MTTDVIVIGPIKGLYHYGIWDEQSKTFFSVNTFENKDLAEAAAYRMLRFEHSLSPELNK